MRTVSCLVFILIGTLSAQAYKSYDGYQLLRILPKNNDQLRAIRTLREDVAKSGVFNTLDFWLEPSHLNSSIDIMVSPQDSTVFKNFLSLHRIPSRIITENIGKVIEKQKGNIEKTRVFKTDDHPRSFQIDQYHSIQEINDWLDSLASAYPNIVNTFSIGFSFEKRDMKVIQIGSKGTNKPGYFIDAGIHAREWISVSTAVYIINELVTKYNSSSIYKELLDNLDFLILPSVNPDGYEYTRSHDRLWRKTRSGPHGTFGCMGADPNRNFDFHWMESGSSSFACSEIYAGPKAFSEIEASNLGNYLKSNSNVLKAYLTLHSYSDLFMYGYGYADHTYPPDVDELKSVAEEGAAAIKSVHGTTFQIGSPTDILYAASGASDDYAKGVANIKYVYTLELRPGDGDTEPDEGYGFVLPESYILPVAEETWAGLQVIAKKI